MYTKEFIFLLSSTLPEKSNPPNKPRLLRQLFKLPYYSNYLVRLSYQQIYCIILRRANESSIFVHFIVLLQKVCVYYMAHSIVTFRTFSELFVFKYSIKECRCRHCKFRRKFIKISRMLRLNEP